MEETESERQDKNGVLVGNEVYLNQSCLVEELLRKEIFDYLDIINCYETKDEAKENGHEEPEAQEIYEWWAVSEWFAEKLQEQGEPVLRNDYGVWWGRTCTGQSIKLDHVINRIRQSLEMV
jgi:hypothetical protein